MNVSRPDSCNVLINSSFHVSTSLCFEQIATDDGKFPRVRSLHKSRCSHNLNPVVLN